MGNRTVSSLGLGFRELWGPGTLLFCRGRTMGSLQGIPSQLFEEIPDSEMYINSIPI